MKCNLRPLQSLPSECLLRTLCTHSPPKKANTCLLRTACSCSMKRRRKSTQPRMKCNLRLQSLPSECLLRTLCTHSPPKKANKQLNTCPLRTACSCSMKQRRKSTQPSMKCNLRLQSLPRECLLRTLCRRLKLRYIYTHYHTQLCAKFYISTYHDDVCMYVSIFQVRSLL